MTIPQIPESGPDSPEVTAHTGAGSQRVVGVATALSSSLSNQTGAAIGALAFPAIGPVGVVAVRQLITAAALAVLSPPRWGSLTRSDWALVAALGLVFSVMNTSLYSAVERIGLGLAVTLEFLGPLTVAIAASRRLIDVACAVAASAGVLVLINPGTSSDILGIALALVAAIAWGCYILLNRALGQRLPGVQGTAAASIVTVAVWLPVAVAWFLAHPPTAAALTLALACGILASLIPYTADLMALRRVPAGLFGTLTSFNPVWAALAGWVVLAQTLESYEWLGITIIVSSSLVVTTVGSRAAGPGRTTSIAA